MYLIYSALQHPAPVNIDDLTDDYKKHLRYKAYRSACEKYKEEIAAIQKYLPDWKPRFDL